ncbi:MAG TPA: hypothetical protein VFQ53_03455 [Kofleriaceae bacterium]|nr:hypothetical protein [Kofleriaceae bacterium]
MRTVRHHLPGHYYHLISRFVGGEWFIRGDADRFLYLKLLGLALAETDWLCLAYAIMSNHIHLAMIAGHKALADWTRATHAPFADAINNTRRRNGPIFARGPKDVWVQRSDLADVVAYIHRNPVRAHVVGHARDSSWTSHRAWAGLEPAPPWLHVERGLLDARFDDRAVFDQWVDSNEGSSGELRLAEIRKLARKRGALELGTPSVVEVPLMARPFAARRPDPRRVLELVAAADGVSLAALMSRGRDRRIVSARRIAVHAALAVGIASCDIAAALGVSAQAVSKIRREKLEGTLVAAVTAVVNQLTWETTACRRG